MIVKIEIDEYNDVIRVEKENQCLELRKLIAVERSLKAYAIQCAVKRLERWFEGWNLAFDIEIEFEERLEQEFLKRDKRVGLASLTLF